jgi:hypothetical protein
VSLAKRGYLEEMVKEEQIDFIALMETGRDHFPRWDPKEIMWWQRIYLTLHVTSWPIWVNSPWY